MGQPGGGETAEKMVKTALKVLLIFVSCVAMNDMTFY